METPEAQQFHTEFFKKWKPPSSGTIVQKKYNSLDDFMKPKKDVSFFKNGKLDSALQNLIIDKLGQILDFKSLNHYLWSIAF